MEALAEQLELLPSRVLDHLQITVIPLFLGLLISLPLGVICVRNQRLRYPLLTVVSVVQTIPSLALLALMVPLFVALGGLTMAVAGVEVKALGFYPTIVALTLYSILPMLRNTVTGILDVDPAMTEAARGVGMTRNQSLWQVELPLALPVIIAGIRTATVWTVGIATLATPVGQPCLGNYIFAGLQTRNWTAVLVGCFAAIALAVVLDLLIGGLQKAAAKRNRRLAMGSGLGLAAVFLAGLLAPAVYGWASSGGDDAGPVATTKTRADQYMGPIVVGSKTFTEQYILAKLITEQIEGAGFETEQIESLGSTVIFKGLIEDEIDVYVDYTGTIWANYMKEPGSAPGWQVLQGVEGWLASEHGVRSLGSLGFENAYALAMRRETAERLGIETIQDLAAHAGDLKIGGDYEFFNRPEWRDLRETYGLGFADRTTFDATFMYDALMNDQVQVISAFSSDGRIEQFDLVILKDNRFAIPPYDAIVLLSPRAANRPGLAESLGQLIQRIDVKTMRHANYMVDRDDDKSTVTEAARWLAEQAGRE